MAFAIKLFFRALIGKKEGGNEWEQLWWQQVAPKRFVLCCIPFFVYDLSLGDEVKTDEDNVLLTVLKRSGQVSFRVWFGGGGRGRKEKIHGRSSAIGPICGVVISESGSFEYSRFA